MTYDDTLSYLYSQLPMFQRIGASAYKVGLDTSLNLSALFGEPHKSFKSIHIAGTNGKGSVSHTLAACLQSNGYKVGLYTSPHLIDFRERIRVNGKMIPKESVIEFVSSYINLKSDLSPSFFELTMMMAFDYFRNENVDYAIIEVGMGGRLDSTNIISPILSVITNISFDHTQFLGDTLTKIASEKAGIIKPNIPVVIGENINEEVKNLFGTKSEELQSPISFAEDNNHIISYIHNNDYMEVKTDIYGTIKAQLQGEYQLKNINTIIESIKALKALRVGISDESVKNAFENVSSLTGIMGRWMKVKETPKVICDTGHNVGGFAFICDQLKKQKYDTLRMVIGFVNDKDVNHILEMLPKTAEYYFAKASIPRALDTKMLSELANEKGLVGKSYESVKEAYTEALKESASTDMIYVGGSTFIVADFLEFIL